MKANALKKLIKEAVKEAIQEELKEVLLEAVKSPKSTIYESKLGTPTTDVAASVPSTPSLSLTEQKKKYMDVIGETALSFTSKDAQGFGNKPFNPKGTIDTTSPNGALPAGEVGMDQIMGLMTNR
jgi:hypothetical protein